MIHSKTWIEAQQPFIREGLCIRTLKQSHLKMAYGDERLRLLREAKAVALPSAGGGRRMISFVLALRPRGTPASTDLEEGDC